MNRIRAGRLTAWASLCALAALGLMGTAQGAPAGQATTAASPPPIADFFRDPQVRRPKLSPDGRAVAMIVSNSESERSALAVIEPDQGNRITLVASFTDSDIAFFDWVGSATPPARTRPAGGATGTAPACGPSSATAASAGS